MTTLPRRAPTAPKPQASLVSPQYSNIITRNSSKSMPNLVKPPKLLWPTFPSHLGCITPSSCLGWSLAICSTQSIPPPHCPMKKWPVRCTSRSMLWGCIHLSQTSSGRCAVGHQGLLCNWSSTVDMRMVKTKGASDLNLFRWMACFIHWNRKWSGWWPTPHTLWNMRSVRIVNSPYVHPFRIYPQPHTVHKLWL